MNDDIARVRMHVVKPLVQRNKDLLALRSVLEQAAQRDAEQAHTGIGRAGRRLLNHITQGTVP